MMQIRTISILVDDHSTSENDIRIRGCLKTKATCVIITLIKEIVQEQY
jgi:hypothetical protein